MFHVILSFVVVSKIFNGYTFDEIRLLILHVWVLCELHQVFINIEFKPIFLILNDEAFVYKIYKTKYFCSPLMRKG